MLLLAQAAPLLVLVAVLASRRGGPLAPVLAALALAVPAAALSLGEGMGRAPFLASETLRGAWLALPPAAITVAGLLFHEAVSSGAAWQRGPAERSHARLFTAVFLLGPFFETVTGFGIGVVFSLSAMRRLAVPAPAAAALALLSLVLIPWGGLGPGTQLGAALAGVDLGAFGAWTAAASALWLLLLLPLFWRLAREAGLGGTPLEKAADAASMAGLAALLVGANLIATVEVAGLIALAPPLLLQLLRETGGLPDRAARRAATPYVALAAVLLATRLAPPLAGAMTAVAVFRPWPDLPAFALLHHPASLLAAVAALVLALRGVGFRAPAGRALARARMPVLLMLLYVVLARWLAASGAAAALARALAEATGPELLPFVTPLLGAAGGFFAGTNVASNSILMPIQAALSAKQDFPAAFLPALQNFVGSAFCIVAPMRIAATAALAADGTEEADLYRRLWWSGASSLVAACICVAALRPG